MATRKVSERTAILGSAVDVDADYVPITDSSVPESKKILVQELVSAVVTADQQAALAGSEGTPSGSNKYVTDSDSRLDAFTVPSSPTRVAGTVYQNTTGHSIFVAIRATLGGTDDDNKGGMTAQIGSTSTPNLTVASVSLSAGFTQDSVHAVSLFFIVPDDYYYKIVDSSDGTGTAIVTGWIEG